MIKIEACPICKSLALEPYAMKQVAGFPHLSRSKCSQCSIVFANPMATTQELNLFYANYYDKGNFEALEYKNKTIQLFKDIDASAVQDLQQFDKTVFRYAPNAVFLDIGFGLGFQLYLAQKVGAAFVYGTELDKDAIDFVKPYLPNSNLFHGDLAEAKYHDNFFDTINLCHVIEHVLDPIQYAQELYRITKQGGVLIVATPNISSWPYRLYRCLNFLTFQIPSIVDGLEHTFIFNKENLKALFYQAGFKVVSHYSEAVNDSFASIFRSNLSFKKKVLRFIQTKLKINQVLVLSK